ncbi:antA/AntB antirepressor family protein [Solidesulfovibrio sp.]
MAKQIITEPTCSGNTAISAQLVPVVSNTIGEAEVPTVNARELHAFLKVETKFADWIVRRIEEYGFTEGEDFISNLRKTPRGGRPTTNYHLTMDMAKELSMVERTPQGQAARRYFIECERRVFASARPSADLSKLTTVADRRPLKALVDAWVAAAKANGKFLAHTEAFRIARTPVGGRKMKELTLADIPVAMAYVQEQLERELAAASPMVAAITAAETPALPPAKKRNDLGDYDALYKELPDSPGLWLDLMNKTYEAAERFGREIEAIRDEATKPFRVGRKSMGQTYFDAAMSPMYSLFDAAREDVRSTYRLTYDALEGCRDAWLLLKKG